MKLRNLTLVLIAAALSVASPSQVEAMSRGVDQAYLAGSYSAVLSGSGQHLQLLDASGAVSAVDIAGCGPQVALPPGLWLMTRDRSGAARLVAPSATPLPGDHSGEIAVAACGEAESSLTLQLPAALIATLEAHASTILVQR